MSHISESDHHFVAHNKTCQLGDSVIPQQHPVWSDQCRGGGLRPVTLRLTH